MLIILYLPEILNIRIKLCFYLKYYKDKIMAIYYIAANGNDTSYGSITAPWKTIAKVNSFLFQPGDTILFRCGDIWTGTQLRIARSGTLGNPITFGNYDLGEIPIIDGTGIAWGAYEQGIINLDDVSYITVSGLSAKNSGKHGIMMYGSSNIIIKNCYTYGTAVSGISTWGCSHILIDGCEVEYANVTGSEENISIASTSWDVEIRYTEVHHGGPGTGGEGLNIKDGSHDVNIHHCVVHDEPKFGYGVDAWTRGCYNIKFYDNIAYNCGYYGYILESEQGGIGTNLWVYNNIAYNCTKGGYCIPNWGISGPVSNCYFINNVAYNCQGPAFQTMHSNMTNVVVRNNIFSNNRNPQINLNSSSVPNVVIDHNLFFGGTSAPLGTSYVIGDPKFVNAVGHDFHLLTDSAAIAAGDILNAPIDDFDGVIRGELIDIGPYEFEEGENNMATSVNMSGISSGNLPTDPVTLTVLADKPALFSSIVVNYVSPQPTGTIVLTPAGTAGIAIITVTVKNDKPTNNTTVRSFKVTLQSVNTNPPTIDPIADIVITI